MRAWCGLVISPLIPVGVRVAEVPLDGDGDIFVDRAGVGLLFLNTEFGKQLENLVRLYFEFPSQLVNSNLQLHK
jgi:hypothetical protein